MYQHLFARFLTSWLEEFDHQEGRKGKERKGTKISTRCDGLIDGLID